jgi:signal transduction histidine kinase
MPPDDSSKPTKITIEILFEAAQEIFRTLDEVEVCQKLNFWIKRFFPFCQVSILLNDTGLRRSAFLMKDGTLDEDLEAIGQALKETGIAQVFTSGQVTRKPGEDEFELSRVIFPLLCKGQVIGVLILAGEPDQEGFVVQDIDLISFLANQAAVSIETARLYTAEHERLQIEEKLIQAERKLAAGLKPIEMPAAILAQLAEVVPYERGSFLLREGNILRIAAQRGFPKDERTQRLTIPLREGDVYYQIVDSCRSVLIDDVTQAAGWSQVPWLPLNLSWLGLPLFSKDEVVGMVSLTRRARGAFSREDVLMATTFALQAAVALENAALYEEITRFNQQLEQMVQQRTEELKKALATLERMDKNKTDFINVAAHELRTPLTIMKGYLGMLQSNETVKAAPVLAQALDGILKGTERLHEIINSMLDVARIDNQVLNLRPESIALSSIIKRVQSDYSSYLVERKQVLHLVDLDRLPFIQGDALMLLKVFQNVVINAIKYTPDGGTITISGGRMLDERVGDCVEIKVQDTGIGIDLEQQEVIFEKFYSTGNVSLHSSGKSSFKGGGPGLGLAIARGIILAHGGRIWAESPHYDEDGCPGSCFHILLPLGTS